MIYKLVVLLKEKLEFAFPLSCNLFYLDKCKTKWKHITRKTKKSAAGSVIRIA